jgi:hypothetical protein
MEAAAAQADATTTCAKVQAAALEQRVLARVVDYLSFTPAQWDVALLHVPEAWADGAVFKRVLREPLPDVLVRAFPDHKFAVLRAGTRHGSARYWLCGSAALQRQLCGSWGGMQVVSAGTKP